MKKIVVLNSGGFDSTMLLRHLARVSRDTGFYNLYFKYGANNEEEQLVCVKKNINHCKELCDTLESGNIFMLNDIELSPFYWTKGGFYSDNTDKSHEECYLEWRNLVFLSYAISFASSVGAEEIYVAFLKGTYEDTSMQFVENLNNIAKGSNIKVVAPFIDKTKVDLFKYATKYRVRKGDWFSCDVPVDGKPCGKCIDCKDTNKFEKVLNIDHPHKAYVYGDYKVSDEFIEVIQKNPIIELRALINNSCQLSCRHCFYGFGKSKSVELSRDDYYTKVIKPSIEGLGVKNVHFSGKEPLYDPEILYYYLDRMEKDELLDKSTFNIVTNGLAFDGEMAAKLKDYGIDRMFFSIDNGVIRSNGAVFNRCIPLCEKYGIPVTLFYDLYNSDSISSLEEVVEQVLYPYRGVVNEIYFRTVRGIGKAADKEMLSVADLEDAFKRVQYMAWVFEDTKFSLNYSLEYEGSILDSPICNILDWQDSVFSQNLLNNFILSVERYCLRYYNTISVTPDGYVLGCASEVASNDYDKISVGNVMDNALLSLVDKAKREIVPKCNSCYECGNKKCSFLMNPLEF